MTTQRPDKRPALEAEHKILKQQVAELRYEHNRLQRGGGTKEEHRQHIHKLRAKIFLLVDASTDAAGYAAVLRASYRVATTASADVARQFLRRQAPGLLITELDLPGGDGVEICREAKRLTLPPPVLVTTSNADRVPDALAAGCDGVLLKPFAPNLLFARIGRLLRARSEALRVRARNQGLKTAHLTDRSEALLGGTNRVWPNTHCPYCNHGGVTSFEFCSHRRAWFACLECRKVWIAKRLE